MKTDLKELIGKTVLSLENKDNEELIFHCDDNSIYKLWHPQDCCESVSIDDINGDLQDLVGSPILMAEEVSDYTPTSEEDIKTTNECNEWGSCTWTFYKLATIKGYVDIRWFGQSNGYYSESVYFSKADEKGQFDPWGY